jgi:molybdenum cofactor synthesis domain-containing protein
MDTKTIEVKSVNISEIKGTIKKPIASIELFEEGVKNDAHSGKWNRMVSLLGIESVNKFAKEAGREIAFGEFAENITTEGLELFKTLPLDRFVGENVVLEVTQIGKKCHGSNCEIFREVGNCVMPKEGIFARVIEKGNLKAGDSFEYLPRVIKVGIITLSTRAAAGLYKDGSGPTIEKMLTEFFADSKRPVAFEKILIPDDEKQLEENIQKLVTQNYDVIVTTGGTGIGPKDITPEVVLPMLDKEIPGIMDLIRLKYGEIHPSALTSRSVAGVIDKSLVYCLPGSPRAVKEYLAEIQKTIMHSIYMLHELELHG